MKNTIMIGCLVDYHTFQKCFDSVYRVINLFENNTSEISVYDFLEMHKKNTGKEFQLDIYSVELEEIETRYYIFGVDCSKIEDDKTIGDVKKYVKSYMKEVLNRDFETNFYQIDDDISNCLHFVSSV